MCVCHCVYVFIYLCMYECIFLLQKIISFSFIQHAILFPRLFSCCYQQQHEHDRLKDDEIYTDPEDKGKDKVSVTTNVYI